MKGLYKYYYIADVEEMGRVNTVIYYNLSPKTGCAVDYNRRDHIQISKKLSPFRVLNFYAWLPKPVVLIYSDNEKVCSFGEKTLPADVSWASVPDIIEAVKIDFAGLEYILNQQPDFFSFTLKKKKSWLKLAKGNEDEVNFIKTLIVGGHKSWVGNPHNFRYYVLALFSLFYDSWKNWRDYKLGYEMVGYPEQKTFNIESRFENDCFVTRGTLQIPNRKYSVSCVSSGYYGGVIEVLSTLTSERWLIGPLETSMMVFPHNAIKANEFLKRASDVDFNLGGSIKLLHNMFAYKYGFSATFEELYEYRRKCPNPYLRGVVRDFVYK